MTEPSPYSLKADVRLEAGKITSLSDLPDAEVDDKIRAADREIDDKTGKTGTGWSGTEYDFYRVKEISKIIAAALCRARFDPKKAQEQLDFGHMLLEELAGELGAQLEMVVDKGEFQTFPKNPNALWSRGRMGTQGINPATIDPDSIYELSDS